MDVPRAAELKQRLREGGLRATVPRADVLAALEELGGHRTADEVRDRLVAAGRPLPRSSVYHVLATLADAGLVLTANVGPGPVRYEAGADWHHHFVCRRCGRIVDVPCIVGAKPCMSAGTHVGIIEEVQVTFSGVCTECAREAAASGSGGTPATRAAPR